MKPEIVCLCGSSRFVDIMAVVAWLIERDEGKIVMPLHLLPHWYPDVPAHHLAEAEGVAEKMDELHLRKIDLADEIGAANQAVSGSRKSIGKIGPGQKTGIYKNRIRDAVGRYLGQPPEKEREYYHGENRLDNGPKTTQNRLLVSNLDLSLGQKIKKFTVLPNFLQVDRNPSFAGFDYG